jgi:flavin-binding protein dodecin
MRKIKSGEVTGYSSAGIDEAIQDALDQVGQNVRVEVVESRGTRLGADKTQYQVTLSTFDE